MSNVRRLAAWKLNLAMPNEVKQDDSEEQKLKRNALAAAFASLRRDTGLLQSALRKHGTIVWNQTNVHQSDLEGNAERQHCYFLWSLSPIALALVSLFPS